MFELLPARWSRRPSAEDGVTQNMAGLLLLTDDGVELA